MGKWIDFVFQYDTGKTKVYHVVTKEDSHILGQIRWFGAWRKYAFFPESYTAFEPDCLTDIATFIRSLMEAREINPIADIMMEQELRDDWRRHEERQRKGLK